MRKAIITLLAVLMLISFVSCNDQKVTEEMREQAMKDFIATMEASGQYCNIYGEGKDAEYDLSDWNSTTADKAENKQIVLNIIRQLVGYQSTITSAKGAVEFKDVKMSQEGTYKNQSWQVIVEGVEIAYTEGGVEKTLTLDYDISMTAFESSEAKEAGGSRIVKKFVLDGKAFKPIEYAGISNTDTETVTITKATCDGIDLDCDKIAELIQSLMQ